MGDLVYEHYGYRVQVAKPLCFSNRSIWKLLSALVLIERHLQGLIVTRIHSPRSLYCINSQRSYPSHKVAEQERRKESAADALPSALGIRGPGRADPARLGGRRPSHVRAPAAGPAPLQDVALAEPNDLGHPPVVARQGRQAAPEHRPVGRDSVPHRHTPAQGVR